MKFFDWRFVPIVTSDKLDGNFAANKSQKRWRDAENIVESLKENVNVPQPIMTKFVNIRNNNIHMYSIQVDTVMFWYFKLQLLPVGIATFIDFIDRVSKQNLVNFT